MKENKLRIAVLPGDGIGLEVTESVLPVFDKLDIDAELTIGDIGWEFWRLEGNPVPTRTWELIEKSDTVLLGAITSKTEEIALAELSKEIDPVTVQYVSPVIQLRQRLSLYANIRPAFSIEGNSLQLSDQLDMVIIRENTEGLYSGYDFHPVPSEILEMIKSVPDRSSDSKIESGTDAAVALRIITKNGIYRILRFAFEWARQNGRKHIVWADKPNVLRRSGQFVIDSLRLIARDFPDLTYEVSNVDAVAMWMVRDPKRFDVIVSENMFGDILSDLGAGIMGGLGLAPSANVGIQKSYFEPVHGSAPKHAGKKIANPAAMFLTVGMLLRHHGYIEESNAIKFAVQGVIKSARHLTYDLGGSSGTFKMAGDIVSRC